MLFANLVWLVISPLAFFPQTELSDDDKELAAEIFAGYSENREKLGSYAMVATVERKTVNQKDPTKSGSQVCWYLKCKSKGDSKRRYDFLARASSTNSLSSRSLFVHGQEFLVRYGSHEVQHFDLSKLTVEEQAQQRVNGGMAYLEPLNLPLGTGSEFFGSSLLPRTRAVESRYLSEFKLVASSKDLKAVELHYRVSENRSVYHAFRFVIHGDLYLPTQSSLYRKELDGSNTELGSVTTNWGKARDCWLPKTASGSSITGNPKLPVTLNDYEADFSYVPESSFPESVFDAKQGISSIELRDLILKYDVLPRE